MVHRLRTAYCKLHRFHHGNAFVSPIISERSEEMPVGIRRQHTRLNRFHLLLSVLQVCSPCHNSSQHRKFSGTAVLFPIDIIIILEFLKFVKWFSPESAIVLLFKRNKVFFYGKKEKNGFFWKKLIPVFVRMRHRCAAYQKETNPETVSTGKETRADLWKQLLVVFAEKTVECPWQTEKIMV